MTTVAIIQARMTSERLPGKVLLDIGGVTMLARIIRAAKRVRRIDKVVVATTVLSADEPIVRACVAEEVAVVRGDEDDVLSRFRLAARAHGADDVVRITSDNPLIDSEVTDLLVERFRALRPDYASNAVVRTYPLGLDVEIFTAAALATADAEAREPHQRAHVTPFIYEHPERFRIVGLEADDPRPAERWTVDTAADLEFVRQVVARLGPGSEAIRWRQVVEVLDREPSLRTINASVRQKTLSEG